MVDITPFRPLPRGLHATHLAGDVPTERQKLVMVDKAVVSLFQTLPAIDVAKVAEIKAAIASGRLTISPMRIAEAILADRSRGWT